MRNMTVVVTGAAGSVGTQVIPYLKKQFSRLVLSDIKPPGVNAKDHVYKVVDLRDFEETRKLMKGVDAVIHLGGYPREAEWDTIRDANFEATYNVFEAARIEGVARLIFASSNHATGFRRADEIISEQHPPRPDSLYGVSKVFGEALTTLYSDKYGMKTMAIRIGHISSKPRDLRRLSIWMHPEDLAQMIVIGLHSPSIMGQILFGTSESDASYYSNQYAKELGYKPKHKAYEYRQEIENQLMDPIDKYAPSTLFQGGFAAALGFTAELETTLEATSISENPLRDT